MTPWQPEDFDTDDSPPMGWLQLALCLGALIVLGGIVGAVLLLFGWVK